MLLVAGGPAPTICAVDLRECADPFLCLTNKYPTYLEPMRKFLPLLLLMLGIVACARAGSESTKVDVSWMTDAEAAMAKAKAEKKVVLMDFTGSDWCVWCHRLDGEVFSTETFKKYAGEHLVLLKLDFPRKSPQSEAEKRQNMALAEKYEIQGFPTVLVFSPEGEKIGELGYQRGGPEAWLASLKEITRS